ncbi:hypothetical protein EZV62_015677 [Acer yangbiense]|uniref:Proline dehydrogenase n=1 Tax=Acer yangbiense TaxID=1000413 RepID=A0A5C7HLX4_9ROSI|nr:hypothetical protein EZV62_015677 [Acer yangbiense]
MATRLLQSKLLLHNNLRRHLTSASSSSTFTAVPPLNITQKTEPTTTAIETERAKPNNSIIDINDHQKLFGLLSTSKLLRAAFNLHLAAIESIVDLGTWVMNSKMMEMELARDVVLGTVKHTFYEHFCAGESAAEVRRCVGKLNEAGLRAMLVYAVEHTNDKTECQQNLQGFLQTVQSVKSLPPSSVRFHLIFSFLFVQVFIYLFIYSAWINSLFLVSSVIVKISAICPMSLLERVSDLLRWQQKDPSLNLPWKLNTFPIFSDCSPLYHTQKKPDPLTPEEETELQLGHERLLKLCQECVDANVPLAVDAEDTLIQPAIDYMTYSSAILYNRDDRPIVYNTMQAYLKDAKERLFLATKDAEKMKVPMGFKLVRGAYMSSETKFASSLGCESPIHNTIQDTHACYNDCASLMLEKIANGSSAVVLATHNVESGQLAAAKAKELGIDKGNEKLEFAQLYGMSEALSFGIRNAGFQVSKYMPFGPVEMIIPYLLRRAEENRGFLSTSNHDRLLIRKELNRRLKAVIF